MENTKKVAPAQRMNVLLLGCSGVGKSTLIKAAAGEKVRTADIDKASGITIYDSAIWPIRFIDTTGFNDNIVEQLKTIRQIKRYTRKEFGVSAQNDDDCGIDAVWYCIDGVEKKQINYNIDMMNTATRDWKNVPIFVAVTKSYSDAEDAENVELVKKSFSKTRVKDLRLTVPVVAECCRIGDETTVEPKGVEELCTATVDCMSGSKEIREEVRTRMIREQKLYTANAIVGATTAAAVVVAAVPIPFPDSLILVPLEVGMTKGIFKAYKVNFSEELVTALVGSTVITSIAKSLLKVIPLAGAVLNAVVAGFIVTALGESVVLLADNMSRGSLGGDKIDDAVDFVTDKMKDNAVLGFAVTYLEENADKLKAKSAKEIISKIEKEFKKHNVD